MATDGFLRCDPQLEAAIIDDCGNHGEFNRAIHERPFVNPLRRSRSRFVAKSCGTLRPRIPELIVHDLLHFPLPTCVSLLIKPFNPFWRVTLASGRTNPKNDEHALF